MASSSRAGGEARSALRTVIVWFRSDLRIHDNDVLLEAAANGTRRVVPVYCFDPRQIGPAAVTRCGQFPKTGIHRTRFLCESVQDLRTSLRSIGSDLLVRVGKPEEVLPPLVNQVRAEEVLAHKEVCSEEVSVENRLRKQLQVPLTLRWGAVTLNHLEDLPYLRDCADLPQVFSQFRKAVERRVEIRNPKPAPKSLSPLPEELKGSEGDIPEPSQLCPSQASLASDARSVLPFKGGESAALQRLKHYLWDTNLVATYKETRNGLVGGDYSSKFSPWLAHGNISSRTIFHEIKRYEAERVANDSTYWLIFELLWRDYFRFVALQHGISIFKQEGVQRKHVPWRHDQHMIKAWCDGQTGFPFVDANMRELLLTGFMSNRGRQNVASFLTKDLLQDWRIGAEWFESLLIDHDVCSNYGNWNYAAGVGNDPRQGRHFNVIKQAKTYDEDGDYVKLWCPELKQLPSNVVHTPYQTQEQTLADHGVQLGTSYPHPIIDSLDQGRIPLKGANAAYVKGKPFKGPSWMKKQHGGGRNGHEGGSSARSRGGGGGHKGGRRSRVQSGWQ